jgi:Asp-tRNA(Asn)/Glu-tRNA(Gln) amidotransferase A subunit family amidase
MSLRWEGRTCRRRPPASDPEAAPPGSRLDGLIESRLNVSGGSPVVRGPWNDEGLPIGMHLLGCFGDEATLLRVAGQLEEARS